MQAKRIINEFDSRDAATRDAVRKVYDNLMRDELFPVSIGLGFIFTLMASFYLTWRISEHYLTGSLIAGGTALLFFITAGIFRKWQFNPRRSHDIGLLMAVLALTNALNYLILSGEAWTTNGIMILIIACGFLFLSTKHLVIIIALSFLSWLSVSWFNLEQHVWSYFGFSLLLAIIIASLAHIVRIRMTAYQEINRLRIDYEREKAENALKALRNQEILYQDLFENANDLIQSVDINGRFIYVNNSWRKTLGYSEEELKTLTYRDILEPNEIAKCEAAIQRIIRDKTIPGIETVFLTKDRQPIYVEGNISGQFKDGQCIATRGIFRNITLRKKAEKLLSQERILLKTVIDNIPDAIYAKDSEARKILVNKADLKNIGLPEEAVIGKSDLDLFPPDVAGKFLEIDNAVIQKGQAIINHEELLVNQSGETKWLLTSKIPLRDIQGKIIGLVGIGRDITEEKNAKERLQKMNDLTKDLNDKLAMAYEESRKQQDKLLSLLHEEQSALLLDIDGNILGVTEKTIRLTGISRFDLMGKNLKDLVNPEIQSKIDNVLKLGIISGFKSIDIELARPDGNVKKIGLGLNRLNLDKDKLFIAILWEK